jgi:hypothetical protein
MTTNALPELSSHFPWEAGYAQPYAHKQLSQYKHGLSGYLTQGLQRYLERSAGHEYAHTISGICAN